MTVQITPGRLRQDFGGVSLKVSSGPLGSWTMSTSVALVLVPAADMAIVTQPLAGEHCSTEW